MVIRQYTANQSAHLEMREDFIALHAKGHLKESTHLYQLLVQDFPGLSDRNLVDDYQRTVLLVDPNGQPSDSLLWKYYVSVKNELEKRSERRVAQALQRAEKQ